MPKGASCRRHNERDVSSIHQCMMSTCRCVNRFDTSIPPPPMFDPQIDNERGSVYTDCWTTLYCLSHHIPGTIIGKSNTCSVLYSVRYSTNRSLYFVRENTKDESHTAAAVTYVRVRTAICWTYV